MEKLQLGTPECDRPGIARVIIFVADRNYLAQSLIAASQLAAQPDVTAIADIILYLIDIPDAEQFAIQEALGSSRFNFRFLDSQRFLSDSVDRLPDLHVPLSTLGRLVLEAEIPVQYHTIVYMDGDIQIVGPVAPLIAHDCRPGMVLAGCDRLDRGGRYGNPQVYLDGLGIAEPTDYFNAGVIVASRDAWREFTSAALHFLTEYPELCKHYDQSALNAVIGLRREQMEPAYNFTSWFQQADPYHTIVSPKVLHFTGPLKPWNSAKGPWGRDYRSVYEDFVEQFPFFRQYLELNTGRDVNPKYVDPSLSLRMRRVFKSVKETVEHRWYAVLLRRFERDKSLTRLGPARAEDATETEIPSVSAEHLRDDGKYAQAGPSEPNVGRRTAGSVAWLMASRLVARGIDFVTLIVLARTLSPQDFGLISVAMTLIFVVEAVSELPIGQSLVRIKDIDRRHLDTAFTIGLMRGGVLATIVAVAALPFSWAYADARLVPLILFLAFAPISRGLQSPAMVQFARRIDFRRDLIIEIVSKVFGFSIATVLAITTHSYWAIAAGTVATPVMSMVQSYLFAPFKPRISLTQWRSFAGFLGWASLAQALGALSWQSDKLILGRFISKADLGHFSMAADLSSVPEQVLVAPAMRPLMAGFVTLKGSQDRMARAYQRTSLTLLTVAAPGMVGLSLVTDQVVSILLGPHWISAIPILRWLALAPIFVVWVSPLDPMAMALDRTSVFLRQRVIEIIIKIPMLLTLIWSYGIMGAVIGRLVTNAIMMIVTMGYVRGFTGLSIWQQLTDAWRIAAAIAAMSAAIIILPDAIRHSSSILALVATVGLGGLVYILTLAGTWIASGRPEGLETMIVARLTQITRRVGRTVQPPELGDSQSNLR